MSISQLLMVAISAIFINNFILAKFLGLCPFLGVSKKTQPALSMSAAVIFVMTFSAAVTWVVYRYLLIPFSLEYLRTVVFILVIATAVQLVELVMAKMSPLLHRTLGIYLPLITTNCAVFGVTVLNINMFFNSGKPTSGSLLLCLVQAFSAGIGFGIALLLMSGIRERLELTKIPNALKDLPIAFIVASLMSMAFLGFAGFKI